MIPREILSRFAVWFVVIMTWYFHVVPSGAVVAAENRPIPDNALHSASAVCAQFCTTENYTSLDLWISLEEVSGRKYLLLLETKSPWQVS